MKSRMLGNPLVRFCEGWGGNREEVPHLLDRSHQLNERSECKPDRGEPGNGSQSSGWEAHRERSSQPPESEAWSRGEVAR